MSKTEELQYLGLMLTATTIEDVSRIAAIQKRISELTQDSNNDKL